jgi:hypothetical protein
LYSDSTGTVRLTDSAPNIGGMAITGNPPSPPTGLTVVAH